MITLFRRIRQKLIDSGSITKYLLYAIGEILLVVIGILIALQVNNWNEERLERIEETQTMIQLLEDARKDSVFFVNRKENLEIFKDHWTPILSLKNNSDVDSTVREREIPDDFWFNDEIVTESYLINNNTDLGNRISDPVIMDLLREYGNRHIYVERSFSRFNRYSDRYGNPLYLEHNDHVKELHLTGKNYNDAIELFSQPEFLMIVDLMFDSVNNCNEQNDRFLATNHALIQALNDRLNN